jgi:hypothetical protein
MMKGPPAEACHDKDPGTSGPNPLQGQELPHFFYRRILGRLHQRAAFGLQLANALGQHLDVLPLLAETVSESRWERGAIPQAEGLQRQPEVSAVGHPQALRREQPLDAIDDARPLPCRRRSGAMPLAAVCFLYTGDADDTPHPLFSCDVAQEHGE